MPVSSLSPLFTRRNRRYCRRRRRSKRPCCRQPRVDSSPGHVISQERHMTTRGGSRRTRHAANQRSLFPGEADAGEAGGGEPGNACLRGSWSEVRSLPMTIDKILVPPIKCQGIKTKLVRFIAESI